MSRKKTKIFKLTALSTMLVLTLASCSKAADPSSSNNSTNSSFDDDKYDLKDVIFEDYTVSYDGRQHSILAKNVPSDVIVTYTNNTGIAAGTYPAIAHFRSKDGKIFYKDKYATMTIISDGNKSDINFSKLVMNNLEVDYDGTQHVVKLENPEDIPSGFQATYSNNQKVNAGTYTARCDIINIQTGAVHHSIYSKIVIHKAEYDMTGVSFPSQTFPYVEGTIRKIEIAGKLPSKSLTVTYTNNTARAAGTVTKATATFHSHDDNYNDPKPMTATLTISSDQTCKVTINYMVGNQLYSSSSLSKKYGDTLSDSDIIKRTGYSYRTNINISDEENPYVINSSSLTLTVYYSPITYQCSFLVDHGSKAALEYNITSNFEIADPIMDYGYEFVGWFTDTSYTNPVTSLLGRTGDIVLYGLSREVTATESFVLKNASYKWDSTAKAITTVGALPSTRTVTYTYEKVDGNSSSLIEGLPKDVGTYKVTGHFHKRNADTGEVDAADVYTQTAYLTIEKNSLGTSQMAFKYANNSTDIYADKVTLPTITGIEEYISYKEHGEDRAINFRANTTYTYYDSSFNELKEAPSTEGSYYCKASFFITDLNGNDVSDKINPIDPIYTSFRIIKRDFDVSHIRFTDYTYSDVTQVPSAGATLLASGVTYDAVKGKYYDSTRKLYVYYSNNKIAKGDVGSLTACITFDWSDEASDADKKNYTLPAPMYATLTVLSQGTSSVIFNDLNGDRILQTEVVTGSSVAAPTFPNDLTDPNEEYYWKADNKYSTVESIKMNTVFTLSKRYKTNRIVINGYYSADNTYKSNIEIPLIYDSYTKGDTKSLQDLMINFSKGYEFKSFQIGKISNFNDEYFTTGTYDHTIDKNSDNYTLNFYDLYKKLYNQEERQGIVIRINSSAKTLNVEYDLDGGNITGSLDGYKKQTFGSKYNLPTAIPTKEHMKFVGWQVNSNYITNSVYCDLIPLENNTFTIKAIYKDDTNFTSSFIRNNGDVATITDISSDQVIPFPDSDPSLYGYKFVGWKLNGALYNNDGVAVKDGENVIISKGTVFNNAFIQKYFKADTLRSIVFDAVWEEVDVVVRLYSNNYNNDGTPVIYQDINAKYASSLYTLLPKDEKGNLLYPENVGSEFSYWSYNGRRVYSDTILLSYTLVNGVNYAYLSPVYDSETYSIVYDLGYAGSKSTVQQVKGGTNYALISNPKRTGYKFDYWYIEGEEDADGNPLDFSKNHYEKENGIFVFKKNIVLKAHWSLKTYQVVFYNNSNSTNWTDTKFYQYGTILDKEHGWITEAGLYETLMFGKGDEIFYSDSSGRVLELNSPLLFDSDTETVYRINVLRTSATYLVTYAVDVNTPVSYQRVQANTDFTLLAPPTRPGMLFKAWYYKSGDSEVEITGTTFRLPTSDNLILFARFTPIEYSIRYLTQTGSVIHDETKVTFGQQFSLPNASEINIIGYDFKGWRDSSGNVVDADTLLTTPPDDIRAIILYAILEPTRYSITYDPNNNTDTPHTETAKYNQSFHLYADPVRAGYTFAGWAFYDSDSNVSITGETASLLKQGIFAYAGNVRARAVWLGIDYDVVFYFEGVKVLTVDNKLVMEEKLTKLTSKTTVALGNNISILFDDEIFTDTVTIDGVDYKCFTYTDGNRYINPVGLFYDSLDTWKESASNIAVKNQKGAKFVLSTVGGTEFTANYINKEQTFSFLFKRTNEFGVVSQQVIASVSYTFGDYITLPDYPINDLYNFYGWIAEENHTYNPDTDGPDSGYKYVEKARIKYDVAFDRYAAKNEFKFNLIMDSKKAYYIISLDNAKYLQVNPTSEIDENADVYTSGLTDADKKKAMADDIIGKVDKGNGITLPNIAKNLNNNYYKPITINGITFHPCDRTVYKVGGEYLLDGQVYNVGVTGTIDNPQVLEAYSCYVAGEYRTDASGEKFSDFMILRDTDSKGVSFKNSLNENLTDLKEVAFCGFTNRAGAQENSIVIQQGNDFYIPPFYFDGSRVKKVSMIAYGNMDDGAFANITFSYMNNGKAEITTKTNIHIPNSVETILANSFTDVGIVDDNRNELGKSFSAIDYQNGLVFGKLIYEADLETYRNRVTVLDTSVSSSNAYHPMWCFNSTDSSSTYQKNDVYSIETWYNLKKDAGEFDGAKRGTLNTSTMFIKDDSSISLNYFYGTVEEYIKYCQNNGYGLNRGKTSNRYVACFNSLPDETLKETNPTEYAKAFYPEVLFIGDSSGNHQSSNLANLYISTSELQSYNIYGQRVAYVNGSIVGTNPTYTTGALYLINPDGAANNYGTLKDKQGNLLSTVSADIKDSINVLDKVSTAGKMVKYYHLELNDYLTLTATKHTSNEIVYIKKELSDFITTAAKVYDSVINTTTTAGFNVIKNLHTDNLNTFIYFLDQGETIKNAFLYYMGTADDIISDSNSTLFATKQTNFDNIYVETLEKFNDNSTNRFYCGTYDNYVKRRFELGSTIDQVFDGKTILTTLNFDRSATILSFMGTASDFVLNYDSLTKKDNTVYQSVYQKPSTTIATLMRTYIYTGSKDDFASKYYSQYAGEFVSAIPTRTDNDFIYVGTAKEFDEQTVTGDGVFKAIWKDWVSSKTSSKRIYTYATNSNNTHLYPVFAQTFKSDNSDPNGSYERLSNYFSQTDLTYPIAYAYISNIITDNLTKPNGLIPMTNLTMQQAYNIDVTNPMYSILNSTLGYAQFIKSGDIAKYTQICALTTAEIVDQAYVDAGYSNGVLILKRGSGNMFDFYVNTLLSTNSGEYKEIKYILGTLSQFTTISTTQFIVAKFFTSNTDHTPLIFYNGVYANALVELAKAEYYNCFDDKLIYCYSKSSSISVADKTNFFFGTAESYFNSSYIDKDTAEPYLQLLKDNIYFYVGSLTDLTSTTAVNLLKNDAVFKDKQIYGLVKEEGKEASMAVYYLEDSSTALTYYNDYVKGDKTPLTNPNNYIIFGNRITGTSGTITSLTSKLLLLERTSTLNQSFVNLFSSKQAYLVDSITTNTTISVYKSDDTEVEPTVTSDTNKYLVSFYLGTVKEFNTAYAITNISKYKDNAGLAMADLKDYVYTLDNYVNATNTNTVRSIYAAFYLNYSDILSSDYFFSKTTVDSQTAAGVTTTTTTIIDKRLSMDYAHFVFSDLATKGFVKNVGIFTDGNLTGVENDYLIYKPTESTSYTCNEMLYVEAEKEGEANVRLLDSFLVVSGAYNGKNTLYMAYTGTFYTNDDSVITTAREINGIINDYVYFNPTLDGYTLVAASTVYHQQIDKTKTDFVQISFNHVNKHSTSSTLADDTVYFVPLTKTELETNNVYRNYSFFRINPAATNDTEKDLYWNGDATTIGTKYSVYTFNDTKDKVIRAYANN